MKRSEFVKHIANVINREAHYGLTAEELAKEILVEVELLGMLPPKAEFNYAAGFGSFTDYAWEPEE